MTRSDSDPIGGAPRGQRHVLLVIREDGQSDTYPLPASGMVTVGRAPENHVCIDDPSISRRHAILHMGTPVTVQDLGSANGTRIRDARADATKPKHESTAKFRDRVVSPGAKVALSSGDVIHFGAAMAFVQSSAPASRPRRLWPHGYFEGALEKECAGAESRGATFAVMRVKVEGRVEPGRVQEALGACTRPVDIVALYGPAEYEILVVDADGDLVDDVRSRVQKSLAEAGARVRVGVARYPVDGRDPESLVAKAGSRITGSEGLTGRRSVVLEDPAMQRLYRMAHRVADSGISVILLGETGVGKEVLAETIHRLSPRGEKPFLRLNCAAFAEQLLESELFGYERGAFTGATQAKPGLLETANGGTVFLDEVGELPLSTQVKLLRVIEERKVMPVGALKPRPIEVRFISATNRDLEEEIARGSFREDLFFRLNGISLVIPPLRDRSSEIPVFVRTFIEDLSRKSNRTTIPDIDPEAMRLLMTYSWPGNIRELRNVIERALLLCIDDVITTEHMPVEKMGTTLPGRSSPLPTPPRPLPSPGSSAPPRVPTSVPRPRGGYAPTRIPPPMVEIDEGDSPDDTARRSAIDIEDLRGLSPADLKSKLGDIEKDRVLAALEQCAGNQTQAAKILGISRRTLVTRLETFKLPRPRKPAPR